MVDFLTASDADGRSFSVWLDYFNSVHFLLQVRPVCLSVNNTED